MTPYRHGGYAEHKNEWNSWRAMKARCLNPKYRRYDLYGGRGIKVCAQWLGPEGFKHFLSDMGKKPTPKHSLDRIDGNGDYQPSNCRWATQATQMGNMSRNRHFVIDGLSDTASNHARRYDINLHTVYSRIHQQGWSPERAFTTPAGSIGSNQTTY